MEHLLLLIVGTTLLLTGCGPVIVPKNPTPVQWRTVSRSEQTAIMRVSKHFGDPSPTVLKVIETQTEADHQLMYLVELRGGHFSNGKFRSHDLSFSILGNGKEAWAITDPTGKFHVIQLELR